MAANTLKFLLPVIEFLDTEIALPIKLTLMAGTYGIPGQLVQKLIISIHLLNHFFSFLNKISWNIIGCHKDSGMLRIQYV